MTTKQNQTFRNFVILSSIAMLALVVAFATRTFSRSSEEAYTMQDMAELLEAQGAYMRVMAYHQAVAEMEQNYPVQDREMIPAERWEAMLQEHTDNILIQFYRQQIDLNYDAK